MSLLNPLEPYMLYIKIGLAVLLVVVLGGMYMHINTLSAQLETANTKLKISEDNNTVLNNTIHEQNVSVRIANEKYQEVQTQLTEANGLNKALAQNVGKIKVNIGSKPLPQNCPDSMKELRDTAKKVGDVWAR